MNQLTPVIASHAPALIAASGARASYCFLEFFTAQIRNPHTRRALRFASLGTEAAHGPQALEACRTGCMNRLNGWQRLGVVLTLVWVAIVGVEYLIELDQGPFSRGWLTDTTIVKTGEKIEPKQFAERFGPYADLVPVDQTSRWLWLLSVLIVPPAALWLVGFAFAWVLDGFRKLAK